MVVAILGYQSLSVHAVEPYQDTSLPVEDRVNDLVSKMTLSEKIGQLGHQSPALAKFGLKSYNYWNEALHGVARAGLATSFPQAIALSSTWNPELMKEVATAISDEARIKNRKEGKGLTYWSPTINMARDPRWGRSEENYGEDPYLAAEMAVNFIKGMQGDDPHYLKTVATSKHFAANNIEVNRTGISSEVDERSLREYYLPAFEATVKEGGVYSLMSAYNAVNGVPSPAHRTLLTHILRNEWGFDGYVVSDCDATENVYSPHNYVETLEAATALSLVNGTDLNCGSTVQEYAQSALDAGLITEKDIDKALKRILKARFLLGDFDPSSMVPYHTIPDSLLDGKRHRDLALHTAKESIVLLKNEASFLPLKKSEINKIAVIGPNANAVQLGGYSGSPYISVSALQGIADKLEVNIANGKYEAEHFTAKVGGIRTEPCDEGGSNIGYINSGNYVNFQVDFGAGKSKIDFRVAGENSGTIEVLVDSPRGTSLGKVEVPSTGGWQEWTTVTLDIAPLSGMQNVYLRFGGGSGYLFNLNWFQVYNPGDTDPLDGSGKIGFARGCDINGDKVQAEFDKAVALAKNADVAVVVCGTDLSVADEYVDRPSIDLPGAQNELIQAVFEANPNTILVLVNGFSLAINWAQENVPAILSTWYNGQAQGTALAEVLFGDYNPAGRLTTTWYAALEDLPDMHDYNIRNNRTYMYFEGEPLYPFGFGLSYTDFTYSNLSFGNVSLQPGDSIAISVDVSNAGEVDGDEVVQLYAHTQSALERPKKELKGFKRVALKAGETQTVTFWLKHEALRYYDTDSRTFKVEDGKVDIWIGASAEDIRVTGEITTTAATVAETYRQNPYDVLQAEHLEGKSAQAGFVGIPEGSMSVKLAGSGSYLVFKNVDFTGEIDTRFATVLSSVAGGTLDIVLDSPDGTVAGTLPIAPTADLQTYTFQTCEIADIDGIRDVYLVYRGAEEGICQVDWFSFSETVTAVDPIHETSFKQSLECSLFPNPSSSTVTLRMKLPQQADLQIRLYSMAGNLVEQETVKNLSGSYQYDFNAAQNPLKAGMYLVRLRTDDYSKSLLFSILN